MPDYSKSIIYTIRSRDNVYVGSTIDFRSRKNQHKVVFTMRIVKNIIVRFTRQFVKIIMSGTCNHTQNIRVILNLNSRLKRSECANC